MGGVGRFLGAFGGFVLIPVLATSAHAQVGKTTTGAVAGRNKVVKQTGVAPFVRVEPASGFVDDAFAFDGAGGRIAVVITDAAKSSEVRVLDLAQDGKVLSTRALPSELLPQALAFLGDKDAILVVGEDARAPAEDRPRLGVLLDASGKTVRRFGPATDIAWTRVGADDVIVSWTRKNLNHYEIVAVTAAGKPVAKKTFRLGKGGLDVDLLGWRDAYLTAVVRQRGEYIKKLDQRGPAREARWDARTGKLAGARDIADPLEHKRVAEIRLPRPNLDAFLRVTEDLKGIELVGADDKRVPVTLPVAFPTYDPKSFTARQQPGGQWLFTLTVDPVNPDALAKKVADPEAIDLYRVEATGGRAIKLARVPKADRGFLWQSSAGRWAVLRKHKGFDRGGPVLEVFDLILAPKT